MIDSAEWNHVSCDLDFFYREVLFCIPGAGSVQYWFNKLQFSSKTAQRKAFLPCLFWKLPHERSIVGNTLEEHRGLRHNGILKAPCSVMQSLFYNSADYVVDQTLRISNHYLLDIWTVLLNSGPRDELPLAALSGDYMQAPVDSYSLSNWPGDQQAGGRGHRKKLTIAHWGLSRAIPDL